MIRHFVLVPALLAILLCQTSPILASEIVTGPDAGNWTVGDCILTQFAMEFSIHFNKSDVNQTMVSCNFKFKRKMDIKYFVKYVCHCKQL